MKIVLTGGPSAGKTTVATSLIKHFHTQLALVPEAATILYRGGFPRITDGLASLCKQRAIFKVQKELENLIEIEHPSKSYVCDRGTLDGLAYWPAGSELFFSQNGSNLSDELARYDVVIHLEVARVSDYNSDHSDVRVENYEQAIKIDNKIKEVWQQHPRRYIIKSNHDRDFADRIKTVHKLVSDLIFSESLDKFHGAIL
ncbi:MAG: ATP-binding protein [Bdellovibrionales bacterium]|nr:ATP-binding protein [Bdellovibrionales bacterium]